MEDKGTNSARSGRKRTQVGSTNRSSASSPTVVARANASIASQRRSTGARARPMSAADEFSRRDLVRTLSKGDGVLKVASTKAHHRHLLLHTLPRAIRVYSCFAYHELVV